MSITQTRPTRCAGSGSSREFIGNARRMPSKAIAFAIFWHVGAHYATMDASELALARATKAS